MALGTLGLIGIGMQIGGLGLGAFGKLKEAEEIKEDFETEAMLRRQRSANIAATTQEKLHDLLVQKYYDWGSLRTLQATARVKVGPSAYGSKPEGGELGKVEGGEGGKFGGGGASGGSGSATTQISALEGIFRRKSEMLAKTAGTERAMLEAEAGELIRRSKKAKKAAYWSIGAMLLSGLGNIAMQLESMSETNQTNQAEKKKLPNPLFSSRSQTGKGGGLGSGFGSGGYIPMSGGGGYGGGFG